jgi:branched-chain amino acid transport system permease protein
MNSIIIGSVYGLMSQSFSLLYSTTPFFNMTHGSISAIAGYVTYMLLHLLGWNIVPSIFFALTIAAYFSFAFDRFIYMPLRQRGGSGMILLVASLGVYTMMESIITILYNPQFKTLGKIDETKVFNVFGAYISSVQLTTVIMNLLVLFFFIFLLKKTLFGKLIRAISNNKDLSFVLGVRTDLFIGLVFGLCGLIAAIAGVLAGFDTGLEPVMGFSMLFKGIIAAIIGGIGSVYGAFFGALFLGFIENLGVMIFASEWRDTIAFILLIIFLYFKPQGIFVRNQK